MGVRIRSHWTAKQSWQPEKHIEHLLVVGGGAERNLGIDSFFFLLWNEPKTVSNHLACEGHRHQPVALSTAEQQDSGWASSPNPSFLKLGLNLPSSIQLISLLHT